MINRPEYVEAARLAFDAAWRFSSEYRGKLPHDHPHKPDHDGICDLVGGPPATDGRLARGRRSSVAADFARCVVGVETTLWHGLPEPDYVSWLVAYPEPEIVIDTEEIDRRCREWQGLHVDALHADTQTARTILHEVGHIELRPHLLQTLNHGDPRFRVAALAKEEEAAWVWAWIVLALVMGDNVLVSRLREEGDPTPSVVV